MMNLLPFLVLTQPASAATWFAVGPRFLAADVDFWRSATGVGIVAVLIGIWQLLKALQGLRSAVTKEVKAEMLLDAAAAKATQLPQPIVVKPETEYVTVEQLEVALANLSEQNKAETVRLAGDIAELKQLERQRTGSIHGRLDDMTTRTGRIEGKIDGIDTALGDLREDIRQLAKGGAK